LKGSVRDSFPPLKPAVFLAFRTRYQMDGFLKAHSLELPQTFEQVRRDSETALAFSK
jgi:hypothetical protein